MTYFRYVTYTFCVYATDSAYTCILCAMKLSSQTPGLLHFMARGARGAKQRARGALFFPAVRHWGMVRSELALLCRLPTSSGDTRYITSRNIASCVRAQRYATMPIARLRNIRYYNNADVK